MTGIVAAKRLDWGQRLQLEGLQPKLSDFAKTVEGRTKLVKKFTV
jgi:hypothetical protein